ncbi:MAG: cation diffusion facilitator family transporter [Bryobacterales bacterium]|nr:cation diffusion facilitator family transporter [Bryobacterales bacterium]
MSHNHAIGHNHALGHSHALGHGHGTSHGHNGHSHASPDFGRAFRIGIILNLLYLLIEAGVGIAIGSLGLVADAGHNLSDVLSLAIAWGASHLSRRPPQGRFTYGFSRSPILASLFNALLLFGAMAIVAWEAVHRLVNPEPVPGMPVIVVAIVGLMVNSGTALLFVKGQADLNIRGAYLHMVADAAVTLGVLLSGIAIYYTGVAWLDPAVSLLIVAVVLWGTWSLFRDAIKLSLDAVPQGIDHVAVRETLLALPGVEDIHDLHIWALSTSESALTVHLVVPDPAVDGVALIQHACRQLHERFEISHTTIQVETGDASETCGQRNHGAA